MTDNELEVQAPKELVRQKTIGDMGEFQEIEADDSVRLPRLVLAQGGQNNPHIKEGRANDGDLINTLSGENYGRELEVIPLVQKKSTRIRWKSRAEGGGMLCVSRDAQHGEGDPGDSVGSCVSCPFFAIKKGKTQDDDQWCGSNYEIVALVRDTKEPILLTADSIKSTDMGIRDMLGMARVNANKGLRMFQKSYVLKSVSAETKGFNYFKLTCSPGNNNQVLPEEEFAPLGNQSKFFQVSTIAEEKQEPAKGGDDGSFA